MAPWSDSEECKRDHSFCVQLSTFYDERHDLREVVTFYLEVYNWSEPLGMDGRCHFCKAHRVDGAGGVAGVEPHADACVWWRVAKPLFDAETERR